MATNKNQHFVPRCHLRPFTLGSEGAAINLFNLDRKKLIPNAPVKNQCARDYFYGTDARLEEAIQFVESGYAKALNDVAHHSGTLTEANRSAFKIFWLFQNVRTEAAALRAVQMAETTRNIADIPAGEFTFGIKEAVQIACKTFANSMHEIDDLKFCVLKNKTEVPFITSDNPAVLTNRWRIEKDISSGRSFGIGSAGLLTLLPLTPQLFFLGYDGDVYSVPNEREIVKITSARDVIALNRHQFLHCVANVYVHDAAQEDALISHYSQIEFARSKVRHVVHYAQIDRTVGDTTRYEIIPPEDRDRTKEAIMHSQVIHPQPGIWPSQIRIRTNGSVYTNGTGVGYVRRARTVVASRREFWRERA